MIGLRCWADVVAGRPLALVAGCSHFGRVCNSDEMDVKVDEFVMSRQGKLCGSSTTRCCGHGISRRRHTIASPTVTCLQRCTFASRDVPFRVCAMHISALRAGTTHPSRCMTSLTGTRTILEGSNSNHLPKVVVWPTCRNNRETQIRPQRRRTRTRLGLAKLVRKRNRLGIPSQHQRHL